MTSSPDCWTLRGGKTFIQGSHPKISLHSENSTHDPDDAEAIDGTINGFSTDLFEEKNKRQHRIPQTFSFPTSCSYKTN